MNRFILTGANQQATSKLDMIIHCGDALQAGKDRGEICTNPLTYDGLVNGVTGTFINIRGNHDSHNGVKSAGTCLRTSLGSVFKDVVCMHYPSTHPSASGLFKAGDIVIHGHAHNGITGNGDIFFIDKNNDVLNVNVAVDLHHFHMIQEDKLILMITKFMREHG